MPNVPMKVVKVSVPLETHRKLKMKAFEQDISMQEILARAVNEIVESGAKSAPRGSDVADMFARNKQRVKETPPVPVPSSVAGMVKASELAPVICRCGHPRNKHIGGDKCRLCACQKLRMEDDG